MKLFILIFLSITFFTAQQAAAQQSKVTVQVTNGKSAVPFASVQIKSLTDSTNVLSKTADSLGKVDLKLNYGLYTFKASAVGFKPVSRSLNVKIQNLAFGISLISMNNELKEVKITKSKPLMRQEDDKTIVDPEVLAAGSASAFEIIEKTPGIFTDPDGNIYLTSTTPATIFINGREQKMGPAEIASMLKTLPPNSIAAIEIMRTPSAKYEASSSGGIVNIVLKKGIKIGLTGSVNLGMNQGKLGSQWVGLNVNNNTGKVSSFLNMQYSSNNFFQRNETDRFLSDGSTLSLNEYKLSPGNSYQVGYGVNLDVKKKWELSYDGRLNYNDSKSSSDNISQINVPGFNQISVMNEADLLNNSHSLNFSQGLNAKYKIDSLGSEWTSDISFNYLPGTSNQDYTNLSLFPTPSSESSDFTDIKTDVGIVSFKSNLLYKFPKKWTMETGFKISNLLFDSKRDFTRRAGSPQPGDVNRSGTYDYNENINSAYAQLSKSLGPYILKAGTRLENTNMKGREVFPSDTAFNVQRTDFFPYVYFSRKVVKIMGHELRSYLVYRRTIARPGYQMLNPAQRFIDQYAYETGNPALKPQFTNNYEANITVDEFPLILFGVNNTKDIFSAVTYSDNKNTNNTKRTYDNLGSNKETYFQIVLLNPPGKKYFVVVYARYSQNSYRGIYEQQPFTFKRGSWILSNMHQLKISSNTQLRLDGFVSFNGQRQFSELSNFGALNFNLNQQLLKKKLTLSLGLNDVLSTYKTSYTLRQGSINIIGNQIADTRRFSISLRYNFGLHKKEQKESNLFNLESPEKENN
jgi:hypothetical protein